MKASRRLIRPILISRATTELHRPARLGRWRSATQQDQPRSGLTLLEVLLALVIFVGAMAAIGQLVSNGVRGALRSRFQSEAALLCEAKMGEIVAGIVPLQSTTATYPDDPNWSWALVVTAGPVPGLMRAEVTVKRTATNPKGAIAFNLARYVRDPQLYYAAQEEAERNAEEQEASSTK